MQEKRWFIVINAVVEGPYTLDQLRYDRRILPSMLVCEEGKTQWRPIGKVPELRRVFEDEEQEETPKEPSSNTIGMNGPEGVLTETPHPGNFGWLIWIIVLLLVWLFYQSL